MPCSSSSLLSFGFLRSDPIVVSIFKAVLMLPLRSILATLSVVPLIYDSVTVVFWPSVEILYLWNHWHIEHVSVCLVLPCVLSLSCIVSVVQVFWWLTGVVLGGGESWHIGSDLCVSKVAVTHWIYTYIYKFHINIFKLSCFKNKAALTSILFPHNVKLFLNYLSVSSLDLFTGIFTCNNLHMNRILYSFITSPCNLLSFTAFTITLTHCFTVIVSPSFFKFSHSSYSISICLALSFSHLLTYSFY